MANTKDIKNTRWVALIRPSAVRDVQFCTGPDHDPMDDESWQDLPEASIYLGIFSGLRDKALRDAAAYASTHPDNIDLVCLD